MANETTREDNAAQSQESNEKDQEKKFLEYLENNPFIDPWQRRMLMATIEYQSKHNAKPRFAQYLDAFNSVRDEDLVPPSYMGKNVFDSTSVQDKKRRFNEHLARVSKGDRLATAVGKAAGVIPFNILDHFGHPFAGIAAGQITEKALPFAWDALKTHLAKLKMKDDALSHFTGKSSKF
ncbi:MAG: hypothetical protein LBD98_03165 [Endomicrobium sp.]|jgi:hypothetical protein|nr:hypothetical protein [Endomicrobium sp.]